MFEKITIIGCGLIGSSILRNINNNEISKSITVFDKSKNVIETITKRLRGIYFFNISFSFVFVTLVVPSFWSV